MTYSSVAEAAGIYSDVYKSLHGIRPRWIRNKSVEWYNDALDKLQVEVEASIKRQDEETARCVAMFQADMQRCIQYGASDEVEAIRWILESEEVDVNDWYSLDEFIYHNGFSYTPFGNELMDIIKTFIVK